MLGLTECLRWRILDGDGRPLGRLRDLEVRHDEAYPRVTHLVAGKPRAAIPWEDVARFEPEWVVVDRSHAVPVGEGGDLLLARDLLDAQVVDVKGKRVARVGRVSPG